MAEVGSSARRTRSASSIGVCALSVLVLALGVAPAMAATAAPGFSVSDYATGFPNAMGIGPTGLAFDGPGRNANLYVMGYHDGILYKFGPGGGAAGAATAVNTKPISGAPDGIAFSRDFQPLYVTRQAAGDLVEISRTTGATIRTVATGLPDATGLATDPLSPATFSCRRSRVARSCAWTRPREPSPFMPTSCMSTA